MDINPKDSLCYSCKHGLCILQEANAILRSNFPLLGDEEESEFDEPWLPEEEESEEDNVKKITEQRVASLCFYTPNPGKGESSMLNTAIVKVCNRYEKDENVHDK